MEHKTALGFRADVEACKLELNCLGFSLGQGSEGKATKISSLILSKESKQLTF